MANPARPRRTRSCRSAVPRAPVVGMTIAPSLATASIASHSSTWLPSMRITRSPLPTPSCASQVATRSERVAISSKETLRSEPSSSVIHRAVRSLPRAIASNQSIAQLNDPVIVGQVNSRTAVS